MTYMYEFQHLLKPIALVDLAAIEAACFFSYCDNILKVNFRSTKGSRNLSGPLWNVGNHNSYTKNDDESHRAIEH